MFAIRAGQNIHTQNLSSVRSLQTWVNTLEHVSLQRRHLLWIHVLGFNSAGIVGVWVKKPPKDKKWSTAASAAGAAQGASSRWHQAGHAARRPFPNAHNNTTVSQSYTTGAVRLGRGGRWRGFHKDGASLFSNFIMIFIISTLVP
jgi:hypothetical protein